MKTVLVTGANKGIGREVAEQLALKGWHVYLGARNQVGGAEACQEISEASGKAGKVTLLVMDVADPASVEAAARTFAAASDHLDVLINNAGVILNGDSGILSLSDNQLRSTFETNTLGPLRVAQVFRPFLDKSSSPRIINVSSAGGQLTDGADGWAPAYCISKTALNGVTAQLAAALRRYAVNSVCPGWVRTDMGGSNAPRSLAQGAETIVWLATESPQTLTGKFVKDKKVIPW